MFKWIFNREKKVYLQLTDEEYRLVRKYLLDWRNKLTTQGRDASPVNELLTKLMVCGKGDRLHTPLFV